MFAALSKKRSRTDLLTIHMKFVLLAIIGVLLWNSNDARTFTADVLTEAAEIVRPEREASLKIVFWFLSLTVHPLINNNCNATD